MPGPRVQRTLVKSPPELWAEISELSTLARHLGQFGDIRITRLDPETTVVWEGDRARGTVELEPAGWGTKVTLTAHVVDAVAHVRAEPEPATNDRVEPVVAGDSRPHPADVESSAVAAATEDAVPTPQAAQQGLFSRLFRRRRAAEQLASPLESATRWQSNTAMESGRAVTPPVDVEHAEAVLAGVLDDLGSAHHRPFSRG